MPHKLEIRSSKSEIRTEAAARKAGGPGAGEISRECFQAGAGSGFGIRHPDFLRISKIRIWDFLRQPKAAESWRKACCYA
jgi:hypothetical protein